MAVQFSGGNEGYPARLRHAPAVLKIVSDFVLRISNFEASTHLAHEGRTLSILTGIADGLMTI
jgi:hypothetical protein